MVRPPSPSFRCSARVCVCVCGVGVVHASSHPLVCPAALVRPRRHLPHPRPESPLVAQLPHFPTHPHSVRRRDDAGGRAVGEGVSRPCPPPRPSHSHPGNESESRRGSHAARHERRRCPRCATDAEHVRQTHWAAEARCVKADTAAPALSPSWSGAPTPVLRVVWWPAPRTCFPLHAVAPPGKPCCCF